MCFKAWIAGANNNKVSFNLLRYVDYDVGSTTNLNEQGYLVIGDTEFTYNFF
ncbi:hypothetical protein CSB69_2701 [Morganella morganii]|nr:hypothetical protein CSB69_2701 [Morganella morganii]EMP52517.1 hypothetical protein C790_03880 [Morganella morganii SC01]